MKQILRFALVLGVLVCALSVSAYAADAAGIYDLQTISDTGLTFTVTPTKEDGSAITPVYKKIGTVNSMFYQDGYKLVVNVTAGAAAPQQLILAKDSVDPPTESNIKYIDQDASVSGAVSFTIYPSALENGKTYYISVAGTAEKQLATFQYFKGDEALILEPDYALGDVNADRAVDGKDSLLILRAYAGLEELSDAQKARADVNKDQAQDGKDSLQILRKYAGLPSVFDN